MAGPDQNLLVLRIAELDKMLGRLQNLVENALILLTQSSLFHGKFVLDTFDFSLSTQYEQLCIDKIGPFWPSPTLSLLKESEFISRFLQENGVGEYLLNCNQSLVTLEDAAEIMGHHY